MTPPSSIALGRWSKVLAVFPPDVAAVLAPIAARISAALGPDRAPRARRGPPDGFDGLTRRGPIERILLSEWAWLDLMPEELLRRASQGELAHLRRAHRRPETDAATFALLDAGPDQLGAPRLVHLAVLVVLEERAARRGARLRFAPLHGTEVFEGLGEPEVRGLLSARHRSPTRAEDVSRWIERLDAEPASPSVDERFLISGPLLGAHRCHRLGARVTVDEPMSSGDLSVGIERGGHRTGVTLSLPDPRTAVRILRDPFAGIALIPARGRSVGLRVNPAARGTFSQDGRRFYLRGGAGVVTQIHVPPNDKIAMGAPVHFAMEGHTIVAMGRGPSKRTLVVTQCDGELFVHEATKRGARAARTQVLTGEDVVAIGESAPLGVVFAPREGTSWFLHGARHLVAWRDGNIVKREGVTALAAHVTPLGLSVALQRARGGLVHRIANARGELVDRPISDGAGSGQQETLWGGGLPFPYARTADGRAYEIHSSVTVRTRAFIDTFERAVGVVLGGTEGGLLVLDRTLCVLSLQWAGGLRVTLLTTDRPIAQVVLAPLGDRLVAVTVGGELVVASVHHAKVIARAQGEVAA